MKKIKELIEECIDSYFCKKILLKIKEKNCLYFDREILIKDSSRYSNAIDITLNFKDKYRLQNPIILATIRKEMSVMVLNNEEFFKEIQEKIEKHRRNIVC